MLSNFMFIHYLILSEEHVYFILRCLDCPAEQVSCANKKGTIDLPDILYKVYLRETRVCRFCVEPLSWDKFHPTKLCSLKTICMARSRLLWENESHPDQRQLWAPTWKGALVQHFARAEGSTLLLGFIISGTVVHTMKFLSISCPRNSHPETLILPRFSSNLSKHSPGSRKPLLLLV